MRRSGLQQQILGLYRRALRAARQKDGGSRGETALAVKDKFRKDATSVSRKDFRAIEWLLRHGERQVESLESSNVSKVRTVLIRRD